MDLKNRLIKLEKQEKSNGQNQLIRFWHDLQLVYGQSESVGDSPANLQQLIIQAITKVYHLEEDQNDNQKAN
jgi:hypothetical protein